MIGAVEAPPLSAVLRCGHGVYLGGIRARRGYPAVRWAESGPSTHDDALRLRRQGTTASATSQQSSTWTIYTLAEYACAVQLLPPEVLIHPCCDTCPHSNFRRIVAKTTLGAAVSLVFNAIFGGRPHDVVHRLVSFICARNKSPYDPQGFRSTKVGLRRIPQYRSWET